MTRKEAVARARELFGSKATVTERKASTATSKTRAEAAARCPAAYKRRDEIVAELARRLAELDWYQALESERVAIQQHLRDSLYASKEYKFSIERGGVTFGEGDTWEEAIADAESKS